MCGILGICLDKRDRSEAAIGEILIDFGHLLEESTVRGIDATGVYVVNRDAEPVYLKAPVPADAFIWGDYGFWELLKAHVGADTVAIIGHTRAATTGAPECNENNHPIIDGPIIGVHNGIVLNHRALDKKYGKQAEVDSAAIMALLRTKAGDKPLTTKHLTSSLHEIDGPMAIAVADRRKPDGIFLARHGNPVAFHRDREMGVLFFASTGDILREALGDDTATFLMPADTACRVSPKTVRGNLQFWPIKERVEGKSHHDVRAARLLSKVGPGKAEAREAIAESRRGNSRFADEADVDAGERCSQCRQLPLMVYIWSDLTGEEEVQECCACNPYGVES